MRSPDAAALLSVGTILAGLVGDYYIVRANVDRLPDVQLRLVTEFYRDNRVAMAVFFTVFGLHIAGKLGRFDPFHALGALANRRRA